MVFALFKRILTAIVTLILVIFSVSQIYIDIKSIHNPTDQIRDVVQDFLASKALNLGANPYQRLDLLHSRYTAEDQTPMFSHPTPHTPYSIFLFSLFEFDKLNEAIFFWYILQILTFVSFFWFLSSEIKPIQSSNFYRAICVLVLLGADPVRMELILGQWNFILLLFVLLHVYACEKNVLLKILSVAAAVLTKSVGLGHILNDIILLRIKPILIYLSTFIVSSLCIIYFKFDAIWVLNYFTNIGPRLSKIYLQEPANGSLLSSIAGLLAFVTKKDLAFDSSIPFLILLFIGIILVFQSKKIIDSDLRSFYLWATSLLLLPVAWVHCLVLLLPSISKIIPRIKYNNLTDFDKLYGGFLIFSWYFVRQPGLVFMEYLENNKHLISSALNISGVWFSIYVVLVMIYIIRLDKLFVLR